MAVAASTSHLKIAPDISGVRYIYTFTQPLINPGLGTKRYVDYQYTTKFELLIILVIRKNIFQISRNYFQSNNIRGGKY